MGLRGVSVAWTGPYHRAGGGANPRRSGPARAGSGPSTRFRPFAACPALPTHPVLRAGRGHPGLGQASAEPGPRTGAGICRPARVLVVITVAPAVKFDGARQRDMGGWGHG